MAYPGIPLICPVVIPRRLLIMLTFLNRNKLICRAQDPNINHIKVVDLAATKELADEEIYTQSV